MLSLGMKEWTKIGGLILSNLSWVGAIGIHEIELQLARFNEILSQQLFVTQDRFFVTGMGRTVHNFLVVGREESSTVVT